MTELSITVDPAIEDDEGGVLDLLRRCALPTEGVAEGLVRDYVVARLDDTLAGVAGLEVHGKDGLLRSVAVDPAWRGRGVAETLLAAALVRARRLHLHGVYLLTTTAHDYFERQGFADWPRADAPPAIRSSWEFQSGCPASSAFMRRGVRPGSRHRADS